MLAGKSPPDGRICCKRTRSPCARNADTVSLHASGTVTAPGYGTTVAARGVPSGLGEEASLPRS
jgi:hypothetical protein